MATTSPKIQLHTQEIDTIASLPKNFHGRDDYNYVGTYGSDQALACLQKFTKSQPSRPWGLVLNIDPIDEPGQHWVALYAQENSARIELMDSFGSSHVNSTYPHHAQLSKLLKYIDVVRMPPLQSKNSYVCGHYCLAYLYTRTQKRSYSNFAKIFNSADTRANDKAVYRFVIDKMKGNLQLKTKGEQGCICKSKCCFTK